DQRRDLALRELAHAQDQRLVLRGQQVLVAVEVTAEQRQHVLVAVAVAVAGACVEHRELLAEAALGMLLVAERAEALLARAGKARDRLRRALRPAQVLPATLHARAEVLEHVPQPARAAAQVEALERPDRGPARTERLGHDRVELLRIDHALADE